MCRVDFSPPTKKALEVSTRPSNYTHPPVSQFDSCSTKCEPARNIVVEVCRVSDSREYSFIKGDIEPRRLFIDFVVV